MNTNQFLKKWIFLPIGLDLFIYAIIRLVNDIATKVRFWERPWETTFKEFLGGLMMVYVLMLGMNYFTKIFNRKSFENTKRQIAYEVRVILIFVLFVTNTMGLYLITNTDNGMQPHDPVILNVIVVSVCLLMFIYQRANYYFQKNSENKLEVEKLAREKVETELKYLKAQINPHFLFNSINNIYHLIEDDKAKAQNVLEKFSQMLRYQLYECNEPKVSLERELKYLDNFISIEKLRHSEKLRVNFNLPKKDSSGEIAPFLFQPLVENAFKYVGGDQQIDIHIEREGDYLSFKSSNSTTEGLNGFHVNGPNSGIGLENLRRRLELLYPDNHLLKVDKKKDQFEVVLKIKVG